MRYSLLYLAGSMALACAQGVNELGGSGGTTSAVGGSAGAGAESAGGVAGSSTSAGGPMAGSNASGSGGTSASTSGAGGMASAGVGGTGGMTGGAGSGGGGVGGTGGAGGVSGTGGKGGAGGAPAVFNPITIEAETGVVTGKTAPNSGGSGWTGTGYADMYGGEGSVAWMVTVPAAGSYKITWRYAQMDTRDMQLSVNGSAVGAPIQFNMTGDWNVTWLSDIQTTVTLIQGTNTIMLATNGGSGPNFDKLVIEKP